MANNVLIQFVFALIALAAALYYSGKTRVVLRKIDQIIHGKGGCVPIPEIGHVTLHYFNVRGKAEAIRFILEDNEIQYVETKYTKADWTEVKTKGVETGMFPFGQVPVITTNKGHKLAQSRAIIHFIGRSLGLDCNCDDLHTCEMLVQGADDVRDKLSKVIYNPQFSLTARDEYLVLTLPTWLNYFETLAPPESSEPERYFVGNRLSWVDYVIFDVLDVNVAFGRYTIDGMADAVDVLADFPRLQDFYLKFSQRPNIAKFMKSSYRFPFSLPYKPVNAQQY